MKRVLQALFMAVLFLCTAAFTQTASDYDSLVQKGKRQLQAGSADLALASAEAAIKMNADRWEGYALAGGALMNLKRYEEAADKFSHAIDRAPEAKQAALRDLRRQCLLAESGAPPEPKETTPQTTSQAEIVLWKSIENSTNPADFQSYLDQYPHGAFVVLAQRHLADAKAHLAEEVRSRTDAEERTKYTIPVICYYGQSHKQGYGHLILARDGGECVEAFSGNDSSEAKYSFSTADLIDIKIFRGQGLKLTFRDREYVFVESTEEKVSHHHGYYVDAAYEVRHFEQHFIDRWGWQWSQDGKHIVPPSH